MAKFKINAGADIELLTSDELGAMLDNKVREFNAALSEGIRYSKLVVGNINSVIQYLGVPSLGSATPVGSGGTFAAGTYYFVASAGNNTGYTAISNEVSATVVLNGSVQLQVNNIDPNTGNIAIFCGTTPGGENTRTGTYATNGATSMTITVTSPGSAAGLPSGPVPVTKLPTTSAASNGYLAIGGPEPGFIWDVKALIVPQIPSAVPNIQLFINDATYFNSLTAPVAANNLFQQFNPGTVIYPGGSQVILGFSANSVVGLNVVLLYKEVTIKDIGKI